MMVSLLTLAYLTCGVAAQSGPWQQCGGQEWTGSTTCVSGYKCTVINPWYSQCLQSSDPPNPPTTMATSTTSKPSGPQPTPPSGEWWFGTNEAGAEFGESYLPGVWGTHYIFPSLSTITTLRGQGYNTFRVQFKMERLTPSSISGNFDAAYLKNLTDVVNHITNSSGWAVLDPHNYGRFNNNIITDTAAFQAWWRKVADQFKSNARVVFDTNNEYHTMSQSLVLDLNQAAINGIRAAGATQWIFVEGNQWSGAWSWPDVNDNMKALTDPQNRIVYEMHQYLDSDSSGTSPNCVSSTIGAERLVKATKWLRDNGKIGVLGEFAGGANDQCKTAVRGVLDYLKANNDVWKGALWWAAGPWWNDYMYSFEPSQGTGYQYYNSLLKTYA